MSYPAKRNGLRGIFVDGVNYHWRFRSFANEGKLTLQGSESGRQQVVVTMPEIQDPWLALPNGSARRVAVTPKIIRVIIQQVLANGWNPTRRGATMQFRYESGAVVRKTSFVRVTLDSRRPSEGITQGLEGWLEQRGNGPSPTRAIATMPWCNHRCCAVSEAGVKEGRSVAIPPARDSDESGVLV